eukprot:SAG31_NODE_6012_length_2215_cov_1.166352_3_plen_197_part_00
MSSPDAGSAVVGDASGRPAAASKTVRDQQQLLPIFRFREEIVASAKDNPFLVVIGETGSGKTTQLCQYLLDSRVGRIDKVAITQPRRVAAIGSAHRVATERGCDIGSEVGYQVRLDSCLSDSTKIKFLTDGCLLRECLDSPALDSYGVVILVNSLQALRPAQRRSLHVSHAAAWQDEAHERSVATDVLFALLKKAR